MHHLVAMQVVQGLQGGEDAVRGRAGGVAIEQSIDGGAECYHWCMLEAMGRWK